MADTDERIPRGDLLTSDVAQQLSSSTKSAPIWSPRSPRWVLECLRACATVNVSGGVYRVNSVVDGHSGWEMQDAAPLNVPSLTLRASQSEPDGTPIEVSLASYDTSPREIALNTIQSNVRIASRVRALYSDTHDQVQTQLGITAEYIYETMENLVFNHSDYGLLRNVDSRMQIQVDGPPTPDVLDDLLALAWRRPDCFCMHPAALAQFRKSANARSLNLEEVEVFGSPFTAWRGLPIMPTNKLWLTRGALGYGVQATTSVLLTRFGLAKQGIVCLCAEGLESNSRFPYINVDFMGLSDDGASRYLLSTHTAVAVLSPGAIARADVTV
jgi:Phage capsid-like protein